MKLGLSIIFISVLLSCNQPATTPAPAPVLLAPSDSSATFFSPSSLSPYFLLQEALVNNNSFGARKAALLLEEAASHETGMKSIAGYAAAIADEPDLEKQRVHFSKLSQDMIRLVEQKKDLNGELYVAFCPMALNDQGAYWLTTEKKIINPYYGESMLTCGSIEKTINSSTQ